MADVMVLPNRVQRKIDEMVDRLVAARELLSLHRRGK